MTAAAKEADATLSKLKTDMASQVNVAFGSALGTTVDYPHAANIVRGLPQADIAAVVPGVPALQQQIAERGAQITGQAMDFTSANPQAAGQPIPALLAQFQEAQARQAEQSQRQQEAQQARQAQQAQQAQPTAPASVPSGALPGVPVSNAARYGLAPASTPLSPFGQPGASTNDTTQQDRAGTQLGERFAQALTRSGVGMVTGGIQGAASAAGMGATGDLVGALARPLMELVSAPLAIGAGIIGGAAGIGLGVNALQSKYASEQQGLAGSVGTTTGVTPSSELTTAQNVGWSMMYHEADSVAAARQLGDMGVQSGQLGAGLTASMSLARVGGIGLDQTTSLTGSLMQSGMSGNQVGDYFAQLDQAARQSGVSVARLTEGIVHLNQAAGIGQISVNGLAAAQALTDQSGTKIDIAQAMSGAIGATGTTALAQGALLGLNPAQFEAATQDPAKLLDSYANLAKRYDVGTGGVQVAQQAMSAAGFDFSKMDSHQADVFTRKLVSEGPGAAQKYEDSLTKKENAPNAPGPHNFDELTKAATHAANDITGAGDQLKIKGEQAANALVRGGDDAAKALADALNKQPLTQLSHTNQAAQDAANRAEVSAPRLGTGPAGIGSDGGIDLGAIGYDASGDKRFGAVSERTLLQGRDTGLWVGGGPGKGAMVEPQDFVSLEQAATKTGVPLAILLAQAKQEATNTKTGMIDPKLVSSDGGYGLGQFTDPGAAVKYLNQASQQLGDGTVTASNWHAAALNPRIAALGMADYDAANFASKQAGGRWDRALAMDNGGPHPNAQAQHYGASVYGAAQKLQGQIGVTVTVKNESGHQIAHTQTTHSVHAIDTSKKHVGTASYGPSDRTPPAPGIPTFPGHLGGPIRR